MANSVMFSSWDGPQQARFTRRVGALSLPQLFIRPRPVSASPTAQPARATLVHGQTAGPLSTDRVIKIRPSSGWISVPVAEMWEARELLYFLVWRDLKVRYKQTALGATWAVIQPLLTMLIF